MELGEGGTTEWRPRGVLHQKPQAGYQSDHRAFEVRIQHL